MIKNQAQVSTSSKFVHYLELNYSCSIKYVNMTEIRPEEDDLFLQMTNQRKELLRSTTPAASIRMTRYPLPVLERS